MPEEEVYYIFDLTREGKVGEVVNVRARARNETYARYCAASYRGHEDPVEWTDSARSTCEQRGRAKVQWAGVVRVLAFGHDAETLTS